MALLLLIFLLPAASALVDCRLACRTCRQNKEPPSLLEVYCAMCEECKQKRRGRVRNSTPSTITINVDSTTNFILDKINSDVGQHTTEKITSYMTVEHENLLHSPDSKKQEWNAMRSGETSNEYDLTYLTNDKYLRRPRIMTEFPNGCPTPPSCSEEELIPLAAPITTRSTTTTTTTTTTRRPCPPRQCLKKVKRQCAVPCVMPMCPCYPYPPFNYPPFTYPTSPTSPTTITSTSTVTSDEYMENYNKKPRNTYKWTPYTSSNFEPSVEPLADVKKKTSDDFMYMYVGVPKNILKE